MRTAEEARKAMLALSENEEKFMITVSNAIDVAVKARQNNCKLRIHSDYDENRICAELKRYGYAYTMTTDRTLEISW